MKRLTLLGLMALFVLALTVSCGKKESEESDKVPLEVKQAEQMDSTRLDSAVTDTLMLKTERTSPTGGE